MNDSPAGSDFLRSSLHQRRARLAALRAIRSVTEHRDQRLRLAFAADGGLLDSAVPWMEESFATRPPRAAAPGIESVPRLQVAILVIGSRGDVQPFLPIAQRLATRHRVRVATHACFRELVEGAGLEFFPLAGDPHELMDYMVRTGGRIVPVRIDQFVEDVPRKRRIIGEIAESTWRACTAAAPDGGAAFSADLIVANPPSYGHIHCAEALSIPLQMVFTMPWTPTRLYPHPMTQLDPGDHHPVRNYLSYSVVNTLMWGGVADLMNEFRAKTLGLPALDLASGTSLLDDAQVPMAYLFPESLVPRPEDWGDYVDLTNFIFRDRAADYEAPSELRDFLAAGEAPVYVGFGSCVVEDPEALGNTVFAALEKCGLRAVVSRGWAKIGASAPANVCLVDDVPHDWLFPQCRAACHHGGAGTTAASLRAAIPSVVVPFFGDQFFWGQVLHDAGAGVSIAADGLTPEALAGGFAFCETPGARERAAALADRVRRDDGIAMVVDAIHARLPLRAMRCVHDETHLATTWCSPCAERLCEPCAAAHAGHETHAYRWVDWAIRADQGLVTKMRELIEDGASAFGVGADELKPRNPPCRDGVILDGCDRPDEAGQPVHRPLRTSGAVEPAPSAVPSLSQPTDATPTGTGHDCNRVSPAEDRRN